MRPFRRLIVALAALLPAACVTHAPDSRIDRHALVERHAVTLTQVDPHAPLMLGNGDLGFTADITGLQTFPEQYAKTAPLLTMAQWAWHSFPNPEGYTAADGRTSVDVPGRGPQPYMYMPDFDAAKTRPAFGWLRENPHRFSLGRLSLILRHADGSAATFDQLTGTRQTLDMWTGTLTSHFVFDGAPVEVRTRVHPDRDAVMVAIRSPLIAAGRIGIASRYPGVSANLNPDPSDWSDTEGHHTDIREQTSGHWVIDRRIDATRYVSTIDAPGARIERTGPHEMRILPDGGSAMTAIVGFARPETATDPIDYAAAVDAVTTHWRDYWMRGGVVDFSGTADPRAAELERRVVLSQYLSAINEAGTFPPQEEGLFSNSWNGKFHLEIHAWHSAHFASWGRPELLERSMGWYLANLPNARAEAARHGVSGAWWPKMTGPDGTDSPSPIGPFIMWQQPHPIYLAEMLYRAHPDAATLARYGTLVDETARLLATWPRDLPGEGRSVLGPPIIPAQENYDPFTTTNPMFEAEYFRWGLETAQAWRVRRGLERDAEWDRAIAKLSPPVERDGLYPPVESVPDFWSDAASSACSGHADAEPCKNRDHPSFVMAYGLIAGARTDPDAMRRTLAATKAHWDWRQTWGWDFPMLAMTSARLGDPQGAVDWLFTDAKNNQWGVSGMTPRVHLAAHAAPMVAGAEVGPDGPGFARAADTYFPSNGSLLLAVGMMAAGWDGSVGDAPGFPSGWHVRSEGIAPLP